MNGAVSPYAALAVFLLVAAAFSTAVLCVGILIRPRKPNAAKSMPYECGNVPEGEAGKPFPARYQFYAMLLVIFDVEVAFLVPWAVQAGILGPRGLAAVALFFAVLFAGYGYLWRKGDLDW